MTPEEFVAVAEGYWTRRAREFERSAWMVAALLPRKRGQRPPSIDRLLGPQMAALLKPRRRVVPRVDE
jgi:hypothetical protein